MVSPFSGSRLELCRSQKNYIARIVVVTLNSTIFSFKTALRAALPSVALLLLLLHCSVFKVQTRVVCIPSKLNKVSPADAVLL